MQLRHFLELLMLRAPAEERIKTDQGDFELFSTACWGPPLRGLSLGLSEPDVTASRGCTDTFSRRSMHSIWTNRSEMG